MAPRLPHRLVLLGIALFGLATLGPELAHPGIQDWDESAHQTAARGTLATPLTPHVMPAPIWPQPHSEWMEATVWLHKPTGPFWLGALFLKLLGITPLALRLVSLLGMLAAALAASWLAGRMAGEPSPEPLAGMALVSLPFTWQLVQGHLFGDVTDCSLAGAVALAMVALVAGIEREEERLVWLAGALTGAAYLCKTALGLTPLGVAAVLCASRRLGWSAGPTLRGLLGMAGLAALVGLPWNLWSAHAWPEAYAHEAKVTLDHLSGHGVEQWVRPWDALFNEVASAELAPWPPALAVVAVLICLHGALRSRRTAALATVLWVVATAVVLSGARAKVPGTAWGAIAGMLACVGAAFAQARLSPVAALALGAAAASGTVLGLVPRLGQLARLLPASFEQSRAQPVLLVGLVLAALGALVGLLITLMRRRTPSSSPQRGPMDLLLWGLSLAVAVGLPLRAQRAVAEEMRPRSREAPARELAAAIESLPADAVLLATLGNDPDHHFVLQDLLFWGGRTTHRRPADEKALARIAETGRPAFQVSLASEPFEPVAGVPACAAYRLFDLSKPVVRPAGEPTPLPEGAVAAPAGRGRLRGAASCPLDGEVDRWALFLAGRPSEGRGEVAFLDAAGNAIPLRVELKPEPGAIGTDNGWFVLGLLGPHRAQVASIVFGDERLPLPPP